jgi:catechol 2,3-dioxygenase-like lactoylglutathione lyase family enzyme
MTLTQTFSKLTPNLIVDDVERSLCFYEDVLGFTRGFTVPEARPFVFGSVVSGSV